MRTSGCSRATVALGLTSPLSREHHVRTAATLLKKPATFASFVGVTATFVPSSNEMAEAVQCDALGNPLGRTRQGVGRTGQTIGRFFGVRK